jgi:mono/diheme cytochrome c family protein
MTANPRQRVAFMILSAGLLVVVIWTVWAEVRRPWRAYQARSRSMEIRSLEAALEAARDEAARQKLTQRLQLARVRPDQIEQILLGDLGRADRCTTCHRQTPAASRADLPAPFRSHPAKLLTLHPPDRFGCTVCHRGQGLALTPVAAHGEDGTAPAPILRREFAQASCALCHQPAPGLPLDVPLPGGEAFMRGRALYQRSGCSGCHRVEGIPRPDRIGLDLTRAREKLDASWLLSWLADPKGYSQAARMPNARLNEAEGKALGAFLLQGSARPAPVRTEAPPPGADAREGKALIGSLGCLGCHRIGPEGKDLAPELTRIGQKVNRAWLDRWLRDPRAFDAKTPMPNFRMTDQEVANAAAYLAALRRDAAAPAPPDLFTSRPLAEAGKKLFRQRGCAGCHTVEGDPGRFEGPEHTGIGSKPVDELEFGEARQVRRTLTDWLMAKVKTPRIFATEKIPLKMPVFDFSDLQAKEITVFLLGLTRERSPSRYQKALWDPNAPLLRGQRLVQELRCLGCHKVGEEGGTVGPDLSQEGAQVQSRWLFAFLQEPRTLRPLQGGRMPTFALRPQDSLALTEYFMALTSEPFPYDRPPEVRLAAAAAAATEKTYKRDLGCHACHRRDGAGGAVGPDLTALGQRLKTHWVARWLENPQALRSKTIMPNFGLSHDEARRLATYLLSER